MYTASFLLCVLCESSAFSAMLLFQQLYKKESRPPNRRTSKERKEIYL